MTISLIPHRATRRGRLASTVEIVELPAVVRTTNLHQVDFYGARLEVHDIGDGMRTGCGASLALLAIVATADIRRRNDLWWCAGCWPGRRCDGCGAPSGQGTLCVSCAAVDLDADKQIARADS